MMIRVAEPLTERSSNSSIDSHDEENASDSDDKNLASRLQNRRTKDTLTNRKAEAKTNKQGTDGENEQQEKNSDSSEKSENGTSDESEPSPRRSSRIKQVRFQKSYVEDVEPIRRYPRRSRVKRSPEPAIAVATKRKMNSRRADPVPGPSRRVDQAPPRMNMANKQNNQRDAKQGQYRRRQQLERELTPRYCTEEEQEMQPPLQYHARAKQQSIPAQRQEYRQDYRQQTGSEPHQWQERQVIPLAEVRNGTAMYKGQALKLQRDVACDQPYCKMTFCSLIALDLHRNFHAKYRFTCTICTKCFKTEETLQEHDRIYHSLEEPPHINRAVSVSRFQIPVVPRPSVRANTAPPATRPLLASIYSTPAKNPMPQRTHQQLTSGHPGFSTPNVYSAIKTPPPRFHHNQQPNQDRCNLTPASSEASAVTAGSAPSPGSSAQFPCGCGLRFDSLLRLEVHISQRHRELLRYICPMCQSKFASELSYLNHRKNCSGRRN